MARKDTPVLTTVEGGDNYDLEIEAEEAERLGLPRFGELMAAQLEPSWFEFVSEVAGKLVVNRIRVKKLNNHEKSLFKSAGIDISFAENGSRSTRMDMALRNETLWKLAVCDFRLANGQLDAEGKPGFHYYRSVNDARRLDIFRGMNDDVAEWVLDRCLEVNGMSPKNADGASQSNDSSTG